MGKKSNAIVFALAVAGAAYAVDKLWRRRPRGSSCLAQAIVCIQEQRFQEALGHLDCVPGKSRDVLLKMAHCHEQLGNLTDALVCVDRAIGDGLDAELLGQRLGLHKSLGMDEDAFRDVFALHLLRPSRENSEATAACLKAYSMRRARAHKIDGWASDINFSDFFETMFFIMDLEDPVAVFIGSGEYEKCYEYVKDESSELHRFIKGCFCYVNGDTAGTLAILKNEAYIYSRMMYAFTMVMRRKDYGARDGGLSTAEEMQLMQWEGSADQTIQFYLAKIWGCLDSTEHQMACINRCLALGQTAPALGAKIVLLIRQERREEAHALIDTALALFPENINLHCIAIECFMHSNDIQKSVSLLLQIECHHCSDPRIYIFKYLLGKAAGSPDAGLLRAAVEADPRYFRSCIYLGNHLMGTDEAPAVYEKALNSARSVDELYVAYQLLTVVETQNALLQEHPELFEK